MVNQVVGLARESVKTHPQVCYTGFEVFFVFLLFVHLFEIEFGWACDLIFLFGAILMGLQLLQKYYCLVILSVCAPLKKSNLNL